MKLAILNTAQEQQLFLFTQAVWHFVNLRLRASHKKIKKKLSFISCLKPPKINSIQVSTHQSLVVQIHVDTVVPPLFVSFVVVPPVVGVVSSPVSPWTFDQSKKKVR